MPGDSAKLNLFLLHCVCLTLCFNYRECTNSLLQLYLFWLKTQWLVSILKVKLCKFSLFTQLITVLIFFFACLEGFSVSTFPNSYVLKAMFPETFAINSQGNGQISNGSKFLGAWCIVSRWVCNKIIGDFGFMWYPE